MAEKICKIITIVLISGMLFYMFAELVSQVPSADELVFIRITENLPNYYSHVGWFSLDGKTDPNTYLKPDSYYAKYYNVPFWGEPPLDSYLTYPIVKFGFNDSNVPWIRAGMIRLRAIAWIMMASCILGIIYLIWKKSKSWKVLLISCLPLLGSIPFFIRWTGQNWWFYDTFMISFLVMALLMRKTKYKKYIYIPLTLMVASKIIGVFFLIPFIIENKKTALCSLAIVPFFAQSYFVTHDWVYLLSYWTGAGVRVSMGQVSFFSARISNGLESIRAAILLVILTLPPFILLLWDGIKKHIFLILLFGISLLYGIFWAFAYYHMISMELIGMLMIGEIALNTKFKFNANPSSWAR